METSLRNLLLILTPVLFLLDLIHSHFYFRASEQLEPYEEPRNPPSPVANSSIRQFANSTFRKFIISPNLRSSRFQYYCGFTVFFAAMMFALLAPSLPLMWVAVELTTLVSAPLIAYHRTPESLEAMWKYLFLCSIGIGLALFGTMLVLHAQTTGNVQWYKAGFAFILAGYGTKTGLAPFHTWLPDAHSEAPAPVSALLSGALLNCSFYAIVRFRGIMPKAAEPFCDHAMLALGLLSVTTAAIFMVRQTDFKRLLAYSSIEHMGLATILFALLMTLHGMPSPANLGNEGLSGFDASAGALLFNALCAHLVAHSLTKTLLFQTAGNLLLAFGTRTIATIQGLGVTMKGHAALWMLGILFICGLPPSVLFLTELGLVVTAPLWVAATVLVLLFVVFAAMSKIALAMTMGKPVKVPRKLPRSLSVIPTLLATVLTVGGILGCLAIAAQ